MASNISPEMDCTCPVCCDIFNDPVVLSCGHSFCKFCIQEWWKQSTNQTCPVCKKILPKAQPPCNWALKKLSDSMRQERNKKAASESEEFCSVHGEKLKLFCQDDQQLICVICRDAKQHKNHNCVPINEAAEEHRTKVKVLIMHLKSQRESFQTEETKCSKMANHIQLQSQRTEKSIKEEFQKLYKFLRAEEVARIDAVRKEAKLKSETMRIRTVNLTLKISSLTDRIATAEKKVKAGDLSFMQNVKSVMEGLQCTMQLPETPSGALINEAHHLGNLQFTVWWKMKNLIQYTPVILDPNTADSRLTISEHLTSSTVNDKDQPLPDNPERVQDEAVCGSKGFNSGKHSWDVEVGDYWEVGVALKSNKSYSKIWSIYKGVCTNIVHEHTPEDYVKSVCEESLPTKMRVLLDCNQKTLSFFDLDRKITVHTMKYTGTEQVFPYFCKSVKIFPDDLSLVKKST
ncbi:zinc-binding protein A33-like [Sphaeramia orbicularis]|uniref:Zinc-binding protein A33-like n=1 Tax=Sphaeramia orbicularis TaxID=375764 RepID=A0A673AVL1_9TELE|nr:zinc-binding protein A33-like [Sphaeramia orbicularis]